MVEEFLKDFSFFIQYKYLKQWLVVSWDQTKIFEVVSGDANHLTTNLHGPPNFYRIIYFKFYFTYT